MNSGKNIIEPPVITTQTPVTTLPGNVMASEEVKLFEFYKMSESMIV